MADNPILYGFRWWGGNPHPMPSPRVGLVAASAAFSINAGASNCGLRAGDPITFSTTTGMVTSADGSEGASAGVPILGIVVAVLPYYDSAQNLMVPGNVLPSGINWGTSLERQSKVLFVPAHSGIWEVDTHTAATTTEALYNAWKNENADHILTGTTNGGALTPRLNAAGHGTATAQWRIEGVSPTLMNRDFTGNYVKLLVSCNEGTGPFYTATGT